jgi:hypothetical protein
MTSIRRATSCERGGPAGQFSNSDARRYLSHLQNRLVATAFVSQFKRITETLNRSSHGFHVSTARHAGRALFRSTSRQQDH